MGKKHSNVKKIGESKALLRQLTFSKPYSEKSQKKVRKQNRWLAVATATQTSHFLFLANQIVNEGEEDDRSSEFSCARSNWPANPRSGSANHVLADEDFDFGEEDEGAFDALGELLVDSNCVTDSTECRAAESGGSGIVSRRLTGQQGGAEQFVMKVPNNKVGLIIGKGGETIKSMQNNTGARIQVIPLHLPPGDTSMERTLQIDGSSEQIEAAKVLVNEVISEMTLNRG